MTGENANAYDQVAYPGYAFEQTHPAELSTLAYLHGMDPAPIAGARVLELGCGNGANLIPMAFHYPQTRFVGVDLSAQAIGRAQAWADALGLANLSLHHLDIMAVDEAFGRFDYIIAHGVYSWVPPFVREKILALYRQLLAPQGVGFLSFNCRPGGRMHDIARDIMLHAIRGIAEPHEQVRVAREALRRISELSDEKHIHGAILRQELHRVVNKPDHVLFHDDLNPGATSFLFEEVATAAAGHGLQFLGDTPLQGPLRGALAPAQALLNEIPQEDVIRREQVSDFLVGRSFRESLFCHAEVALRRPVMVDEAARGCWIAAQVDAPVPETDPAADGIIEFDFSTGVRLKVDHPLLKATLMELGALWPRAVVFDDLVSRALDRLGQTGERYKNNDPEIVALSRALFSLYLVRQVELRRFPLPVATRVSERPEASRLAREQAGAGTLVNNVRHYVVSLDDPMVRSFLRALDGTRSIDDLVGFLDAAGRETAKDGVSPPPVTRADVQRNLERIARLSLLVD